MELPAATLTGVLLGLFLIHLSMRRRAEACRQAGRLLTNVCGIRRDMAVLMLFFTGTWVIRTVTRGLVPEHDSFSLFCGAAMGTFVVCSIFTNTSVVHIIGCSWIEFRESGVVSGGAGRESFVTPWHRIAHCQWLNSSGLLSVYSFEPFKVAASKRKAVNDVLLNRTELRDPSGNVLNPDFQRSEAPANDMPWPDRRPFRFELKTFLLLMALACSALAWWAIHLWVE